MTFDDGHQDGYTVVLPILQANGFVGTFYVISGNVGHRTALKTFQIDALAAAGMEIADHTVHHVGLALMPKAVAMSEIVGAADWISNLLGARPTTLAYPYGNEDAAVVGYVRDAGFAMALTNKEGCFESTATRFVVPRLRVGPWTTPTSLLTRVRSCG